MEEVERSEKLKVVYNDQQLLKYKKKEIAFYKNQIKKLKSRYAKRYRDSKKIKKRFIWKKSRICQTNAGITRKNKNRRKGQN